MVVTNALIAREPVQPLAVNWSLEAVDVQPPGDDEILVEMRASGICHTDLVLTSVPNNAMGITYPKVAGHEGTASTLALLRTNTPLGIVRRWKGGPFPIDWLLASITLANRL